MQKRKRDCLITGQTILNGRYEILKVIHSKGMANVYLVSDSNLNKQWCLKEIRKSEAGKNKLEYYSLLQEANIMKSLSHSSIPRIVTIEQEEDSIFIIMDYVDGMSIKNWLVRKGRINQEIVVTWMKQICQVMMYLHNRKEPIFYRDMKPDNVMIQSDGNIKLLDFGISVVLKEKGQVIERALGTKGYAAPEQSKTGNVCDLRSDIYGMGMTMYYMLTGLNPSQISKDKLKPIREIDSSISIGLDKIVNKCIAEDPNDRYQDCEELFYALQNYKLLDSEHRAKIRRKVTLVFILFFVSIMLIITSFIPLGMYKTQQDQEYQKLVSVANQTGREEDYKAVLNVNPKDIKIYEGYLDAIKIDGVYTKDEEVSLLNYINPNLEDLKTEKDYGELAFNIGKLYWFYYQGKTDDEGSIIASRWFNDAMEKGYKPELADVYYQLGTFKKNISSSITESSDGGMYAKYWENLIKAKEQDNGELIDLQLSNAIANCISVYAYNLNKDGISKDEVLNQIKELNNYIELYTPNIDKAEKILNSLKITVSTLETKVNAVYKEGM